MTDAIIEAVAQTLRDVPWFTSRTDIIEIILAAATPLILEEAAKAMEADRAERVAAIEEATLERAAKVAEDSAEWGKGMLENSRIGAVHQGACFDIAAAIRALKEQP